MSKKNKLFKLIVIINQIMKKITERIILILLTIITLTVTESLLGLPFKGIFYELKYFGTQYGNTIGLLLEITFLLLMTLPPIFQMILKNKKTLLYGSLLGIISSIIFFIISNSQRGNEGAGVYLIFGFFMIIFIIYMIIGLILSKTSENQ